MEEEQGSYWSYPLANGEVAERGKLACIDTANAGVIVAGQTATGLIPIGRFMADLTGDGTTKVPIRFFHEITPIWWDNDTVTAVAIADRGTLCYIKDAETVSGDNTGRSAAGLVLDVDATDGVLVWSGVKGW